MGDTNRVAEDRRFITETGLAAEIASLAEPLLTELGFRLVRVIQSGRNGNTIQIMAERPDGFLSVEDCAVISRNVSPLLDSHDPLPGSYYLEISSPGIDRPLVRPEDFELWSGYEAKIELKQAIDGRKRFRGMLEGYTDGEVRLLMELEGFDEAQVVGLPIGYIGDAKLVLTDDLVRETLRRNKKTDRKD